MFTRCLPKGMPANELEHNYFSVSTSDAQRLACFHVRPSRQIVQQARPCKNERHSRLRAVSALFVARISSWCLLQAWRPAHTNCCFGSLDWICLIALLGSSKMAWSLRCRLYCCRDSLTPPNLPRVLAGPFQT